MDGGQDISVLTRRPWAPRCPRPPTPLVLAVGAPDELRPPHRLGVLRVEGVPVEVRLEGRRLEPDLNVAQVRANGVHREQHLLAGLVLEDDEVSKLVEHVNEHHVLDDGQG